MGTSLGRHVNNCCKVHGCKYGDKDCPVTSGAFEAEAPCADCGITLLCDKHNWGFLYFGYDEEAVTVDPPTFAVYDVYHCTLCLTRTTVYIGDMSCEDVSSLPARIPLPKEPLS